MRRLWRIYRIFVRNSIVRDMEFRANFFASIATLIGWLFYYVALIKIIFLNTDSIAGWSEGETLILSGSLTIVWATLNAFFYDNLSELPQMIQKGTFDLVVTKPVDSQFFVSTRHLALSELARIGGSLFVVFYGLQVAGIRPTAAQVGLYGLTLACALVILYSIFALLMTLSFWFVRVQNLDVVMWSTVGIARYPIDIFSPAPRFLLTFIVPLAFLSTVPARVLRGVVDAPLIAVGLLFAAGLFAASRWAWRRALRSYSSAGG